MAEANDFMLPGDRAMLAARDEEWRRAWEKNHRVGMVRFILSKGIVRFAIPQFVFLFCFSVFGDHQRVGWLIVVKLSALCVFLGVIFGLLEWYGGEKRYSRMSGQESLHDG
jgi:hypothetical protein